MSLEPRASDAINSFRDDERLVGECLSGSEKAWAALVDKYKNLIFSIPIKYGFSEDDASEIFQAVCLTMLDELSRLRDPRALAAWLIHLTARKCTRSQSAGRRLADSKLADNAVESEKLPEQLFYEVEREQMVREAVAELPQDCARLITLLFFENPPLRYDEAAQTLGVAKGSIGATRMRCLEKLRRSLERKGFRL
jgi:RNA polymerase sigma factor (sigma-70 family)